MVSGEADQNRGSTPPGKGKHHCRFLVQTPKRQNRLDSEQRYLQSNQPNLGTSAGGPVCNSFFYSTAAVFQLEGRSRGGSDGCFLPELGNSVGICTPTLVFNCKGTDESAGGRSDSCAGHSIMGNPTMVPSGHEHASGPTNSSSKHPRSVDPVSKLRLSSGRNSASAGRMEGLWQHLQSKEIPGNAINLIMSSWRSKANSNYNSAWRKWEEWCKQKSMHPFQQMFPLRLLG